MDSSSIYYFINDYIIGFIVLISVLVFVHELGHYLFAKMFKVKVESFSIGFGPELLGWTDKSGTRWKIAPIPFGGYVKMKGEMLESDDNQDAEKDTFQSKKLWQKFLIVFAGPLFNLIFPIFILFFIAFFAGIPNLSPIIGGVTQDSPSYQILQPGDKINKIDNKKIESFSDIQRYLATKPNEEIVINITRNNSTHNVVVTTGNNNGAGFLGISANVETITSKKFSLKESSSYTYNTYTNVMVLMLNGFIQLFSGKIGLDDIGGPVKIAQLSGETIKQGVNSWLFFMALLSLNLAIINLFPIPALDGGYLLLYTIQGITRKKLSAKVQNYLMQFGFFLLLSLMVFVVLKDIWSLI